MAGATGLVGQAVLDLLLADKAWKAVHGVGRRASAPPHPKLTQHLTQTFTDLALPPVDDVFIALGTTRKAAGSREAFRAIDFEAVLRVARSARTGGATRLGVVSAMGADSHSAMFYTRIKGEMEDALSRLGFESLVIVRPSLITGDRAALGQARRSGESLATRAARWINPVLPANYRCVAATDVAQALVSALRRGTPGRQVILSGQLGS